ncbi:hypothetical protein [Burkholderia pseudomallei]|uniref:hypothetical protein n=1 Tax=Burkholderia pseudomallei TaxID=28450 RepID=UPI00050FD54D|nr:hypothetical protein [Burkholderia pseudomallei]KGD04428.1 hypothetical protein DO63_746 [Burkholderia pseudomallei]KGV23455.1 hypothetical protein X894_2279 [Burkholderia pseudomallei MSHR4462]KGX03619.1 hypothetical protein Y601_4799 [Burkholderia pseudomallei MSHR640]
MDTVSSSSIISAAAGIIGVLLGNSFVAVKEWLAGRSKRDSDTAYLAILVASHLNRLANECLHVALDDGTAEGQPAGHDGEYQPTTTLPGFHPLDIDVEWKVLPKELMYSILRLPDENERIQNRLAGIIEFDSDYPDHVEYFWARRRDYAKLGLNASMLAQRLQRHAGMPVELPKDGEWSRDNELKDVVKRIDDAMEARNRRFAERQASGELL